MSNIGTIEMPIDEVRALRQELLELKNIVYQVATMVATDKKSAQRAGHSEEWISGDEACAMLGIPITRSGTHKLRLQWLRESGFLSRFGCRKPYTYSKKEVQEVFNRIEKGTVAIPSRA